MGLQANRRDELNNLVSIALGTNDLQIQEGQTYTLIEDIPENANGIYYYATSTSYSSRMHTGELTITKLDETNNTVSGTFFYDIEDQNGVIHEVREGRFDTLFTQ